MNDTYEKNQTVETVEAVESMESDELSEDDLEQVTGGGGGTPMVFRQAR